MNTKKDMMRQIATTSEYTAQALRAMHSPRPRNFHIFGAHTENKNSFQATRDEIDSMEQESVSNQMSRIGTTHDSVNNEFNKNKQ